MDQKAMLRMQRAEMTEHYLYLEFAKRASGKNREILHRIAVDELRHYAFWKRLTNQDVPPDGRFLWWYRLLASVFGLTFTLKMRELGEQNAQVRNSMLHVPGIDQLTQDEERHEHELIEMLQDERLEYAGSIVLGLNDGLVELTGVLAGLTLALADATIVAVAGLVTGLAAAMSMSASGYFSAKEEHGRNPLRAAAYTGIAYLVVVLLLILPFFVVPNIYAALGVTLAIAICIIAAYSAFIAVAKSQSFWRRFSEMVLVSMTVAAISFGIGFVLNKAFGI